MIELGLVLVGAVVGFIAGIMLGEREGGDFNFAPVIYGPAFACAGAVAGAVVGVFV